MAKRSSLPKVVLYIEFLPLDIVPAEMPSPIVNASLRGWIATCIASRKYVNLLILHQNHLFSEDEGDSKLMRRKNLPAAVTPPNMGNI
jgi:hypothetical protein